MRGLPLIQNARIADKMGLFGHLRRFEKIRKKAYIIYSKCYLETFENMVAANKFYIKNGFQLLDKPIVDGPHFACDKWYIKDL